MLALSVLLSGGSPIDLDGTFFVQFVVFAVAAFLLSTLVFRPMMALFDAREAAIEGTREEAKRLTAEAKAQATAFDTELAKVKLEAGDERDRLRQEGLRLERAVLEKVRTDTQALVSGAEKRLAGEAARIRGEMGAQVPALARDVAKKLLGREVA